MKTSKKLPPEVLTPEGRARLRAKAAPTTETEAEAEKRLAHAVLVPSGGPRAVREALAQAKRTRGLGKKPAKVLISIRIERDTLERWKATGEGWQTRMAEKLDNVS